MLTKKLEEIGLNEKEAKVYVAVLELGEGSASEIAKKSEVNRATTYFTLDNLMKIGLVSASNEEKKQKFIPEDPSQLENIITKQQRELEEKKKTHIKPRLHPDAVETLRHKGGAHGSPNGKKGYKRKKFQWKNQLE